MLHLLDELVRGLLLPLELGPGALYGLQCVIDHLLDRPDALLLVGVDVDVEGQVSQRHQLEHLVLNLGELLDAGVVLARRATPLHRLAQLVGDRPALQDEDDEALHHRVHLLHDLETCLALRLVFGCGLALEELRNVDLVLRIDLLAVLRVQLVELLEEVVLQVRLDDVLIESLLRLSCLLVQNVAE